MNILKTISRLLYRFSLFVLVCALLLYGFPIYETSEYLKDRKVVDKLYWTLKVPGVIDLGMKDLLKPGEIQAATPTFVGSAEVAATAATSEWTEVADLYQNDSRDSNLSVNWKIMGATPDSSVPVNVFTNANYGAVSVVHVWRNADQSNPLDATTTTAQGNNSAVINSPSITPGTSGAIVLSVGLSSAAANAGDIDFTAPSGYSNQADHNGNGGTGSVQAGIASKAWSGSGAEDPAAWTNITTSTSDSWVAATMALKPASGQSLSYVGSAENAGINVPYAVDISGLSLQQGDLVIVATGWVITSNGDPGVNSYNLDLSGIGAQENDLVIVATGFSSVDNSNPGVWSSGWTEDKDLYQNDTRDANLSVSYKLMGATPDSYVAVSGSGHGVPYGAVTIAYVWRNVDTSSPLDAPTTTAQANNSAVINSPAITPSNSGAYVLSIGLSTAPANTGDAAITAPSGYANQVDHNGNGTTHSMQVGLASKAWSGSGAEDPAAWADITTTTSDSWVAATLALRPGNDPPTLTVSQPDGNSDSVIAGQSYNITYDLTDSVDTATVDFYYDVDGSGLDGTAITGCQDQAEGSGATCSWDTTGMTADTYYVYGIATDGITNPVSDYSQGELTITAVTLSISVADGSISYGFIAANSDQTTLAAGVNDMQTATNNSNVSANINIKGQDASGGGCTWTLAATTGSDQYVHQFCNDTDNNCSAPPTSYTALTTSYQTLKNSVAVSGTVDFQLRIVMPGSSICSGEQNVDVTVQVSQ